MKPIAAMFDNLIGIAAMILAMVLLPFADAFSKYLSESYAPEQITWVRNTVHALLILPIFLKRGHSFRMPPRDLALHFVRGLAFVAMTFSYIAALIWMPLADALAIVFLFPLIVTAMSYLFLGEHVGAARWTAIAVSFLGAVLIVRPGIGPMNAGVPFALSAAFVTAIYVVMTRQMSANTPNLVLLIMPAMIGALILIPALPFRWVTPTNVDFGIMICVGALAAMTHLLIIVAYSKAEASLIAPFSYFQIVVATTLGVVIFGDVPSLTTSLGLVIILTSGVALSYREQSARAAN